jgi:hypothetical protein
VTGLLLVAAAYGSLFSNDVPPGRFQGNVTVTVRFESEAQVEIDCGRDLPPPPAGQAYTACVLPDGQTMILPNACLRPLESDFRLKVCHEIGHANGWPSNHPAH